MQFLLDVLLFLIYVSAFVVLIVYTIKFWLMTRGEDIAWTMLEFKVPREINKSPLATEVAAAAFLQSGGVGVNFKRTFLGKAVAHFSLEIASFEGSVHFYIRTQSKFKNIIMSNFYSQYPNIEIIEVEDYVGKVFYDHRLDLGSKKVKMWGAEYKLGAKFDSDIENKKESTDEKKAYYELPADFLPIKTYNDFELNKDLDKGEFKVDPLNGVIEWLGSMKKGQYAYYQLLVQDASKFNGKDFGKTYHLSEKDEKASGTHDSWSLADLAKMRLKKMRTEEKVVKKKDVITDDYGYDLTRKEKKIVTKKDKDGNDISVEEFVDVPLTYKFKEGEGDVKIITTQKDPGKLSDQEKKEIEQIQKKMSKPLVRAYARVINLAVDGASTDVQGILSVFKQFEGAKEYGFNNMGVAGVTDPYDFPWQNTMKKKTPWRTEEMFEAYVERSAFSPHLKNRKDGIDKWADQFFFGYSLFTRNFWRNIYEVIFHPFDHPVANVSTINLEELATLWHLPGKVSTTSGINRIDSVKSSAPDNLPV